MNREIFQISEVDWKHLLNLSKMAQTTPVIAFNVADWLTGRDLASLAYNSVYDAWKALGEKYGFDDQTIGLENEKERKISAVRKLKP